MVLSTAILTTLNLLKTETMTTTKSPGRKPKGTETRKAVTFRLQPSTIENIKKMAAENGVSQSDFIEKIAEVAQLSHKNKDEIL